MPNDPLGPGSAAWQASDAAIIFWRQGERRAGGMMLTQMQWHLQRANQPQEIIKEWIAFVHEARNDPTYEPDLWPARPNRPLTRHIKLGPTGVTP